MLHHPESGDSLAGFGLLVQYMHSYLIMFYEVCSTLKVHFFVQAQKQRKLGCDEHECRWQVMVTGARGRKRLRERGKSHDSGI